MLIIYFQAVATHDSNEQEAGQATELVESMLHNCKGRLDRYLPDMINIAVSRLSSSADSEDFKVLLIEVVSLPFFPSPFLPLPPPPPPFLPSSYFCRWQTLCITTPLLHCKSWRAREQHKPCLASGLSLSHYLRGTLAKKKKKKREAFQLLFRYIDQLIPPGFPRPLPLLSLLPPPHLTLFFRYFYYFYCC